MRSDFSGGDGASSSYRPDIDGLRAISVLGVVLYHVGATWLPGGFAGVDVFFVISGFLITGIIARQSDEGRFSFADFYERRIRRIYPSLVVVLLATTLVAVMVMLPRDLRLFGRTLVWTPLFASNFLFIGDLGYFDPGAAAKPLLHTWSLGVEEQFYIVFPWLLIGAARFGLDRRKLLAAVVAVSLAGSIGAAVVDWGDSYFLLPTRFWELGAGGLLALMRRQVANGRAADATGLAGLALVIGGMLFIDEAMPFPGWVATVPVIGAVMLLATPGGMVARLLASPPLVFVGRISYPMYLWHWPIVVLMQFHLFRALTPLDGAVAVAATTGLSWLSLVVVETPIRSRAVFGTRRSLFVAAGVATVVLIGLGLSIFNAKEPRFWLTPEARAIVAVSREEPSVVTLCPDVDTGPVGEGADCFLGDPAAKRVSFAIVGDSHSRAVAGQIADVAAELGLRGIYFGRLGCPPLVDVDRPWLRSSCAAHFRAALGEIERLDVPEVIFVTRWGAFVTPRDDARWPVEINQIRYEGRPVPLDRVAATTTLALGRTLDGLAGRHVVIVGPIPEATFDVPNALATAVSLGRTPPTGPTAAEWRRRRADVRRLFDTVLPGRGNVTLLDPADLFCASGTCAVAEGGRPLYSDVDHLSRFGAALFANWLRPTLAELRTAR